MGRFRLWLGVTSRLGRKGGGSRGDPARDSLCQRSALRDRGKIARVEHVACADGIHHRDRSRRHGLPAIRRQQGAPFAPVLTTARAEAGSKPESARRASGSVSVPVSPMTSISLSRRWATWGSHLQPARVPRGPAFGRPARIKGHIDPARVGPGKDLSVIVREQRCHVRPAEQKQTSGQGVGKLRPDIGPAEVRKMAPCRQEGAFVIRMGDAHRDCRRASDTGHACALSPKAAASQCPKPSSPMLAAMVKS